MPTAPSSPPDLAGQRAGQRTAGLAMMGSAIALLVLAAGTYLGAVPLNDDARPWAASGLAIAAILDLALATHFLRASSKS